jgi:hypothetical protein
MLAGGTPVHVVAAGHGHNPAVSLSIYSEAQPDDLRAAGAALFGWASAHSRPLGTLLAHRPRSARNPSDTAPALMLVRAGFRVELTASG